MRRLSFLPLLFITACEPAPEQEPAEAGVLLVDGAPCDDVEVITDAANPIFHTLSLSAGPMTSTQVVASIVDPSRPGFSVVPPSDNDDGTVRFGILVNRGEAATATLRLQHGNARVPVCNRPLEYVVD